jgi:uncharacterized protein YndB with AHSA1/START domain
MTPSDAPTRNQTIFSTPNERELVMTRTFDAPRALVWAAFTDPKHLPKWQPSGGATMPVCEIDLRPGGTWHYEYRTAQGGTFGVTGTYLEVDPPKSFVQLLMLNGEESTSTTTFSEDGGRTTVIVTSRYASEASRDQAIKFAKFGTESSYGRLDAYLPSMR